jgi:hypothetical protein
MYPSIKYKFVRRAIKYFAGDLNAETKDASRHVSK